MLDHPGCRDVGLRPASDAYRDDPVFAAFAVRRQRSPATDDGARRAPLCERELDLLGDRPWGRVVDLGCGVGAHVAALVSSGREFDSYRGIDICAPALEVAAALHGDVPGVRFTLGDVRRWNPEPASADTVLLTYEALNNLGPEDAPALLARIARALALGGRALIDIALAEGPPITGRSATTESAEGLLGGPLLVLADAVDAGSTHERHLVDHIVHHIGATGCVLHFRHRWWAPSIRSAEELLGRSGLEVVGRYRVHAGVASDKSSVPRAAQFVLEPR